MYHNWLFTVLFDNWPSDGDQASSCSLLHSVGLPLASAIPDTDYWLHCIYVE